MAAILTMAGRSGYDYGFTTAMLCYAYSAMLTLAVLAMRRSGSLTLSLTLTLCVQEWFHNVKLGIAHQVKNMPKKERQVPYYSRLTKY